MCFRFGGVSRFLIASIIHSITPNHTALASVISHFTPASLHSQRGYIQGRIQQGRWAVLIGCMVNDVYAGCGGSWRTIYRHSFPLRWIWQRDGCILLPRGGNDPTTGQAIRRLTGKFLRRKT